MANQQSKFSSPAGLSNIPSVQTGTKKRGLQEITGGQFPNDLQGKDDFHNYFGQYRKYLLHLKVLVHYLVPPKG